ncbi:MAG: ABC transporter permease [Vallitalea sp.]|nr:ABC transporter permease [Vallitalea sp.]
MNTLLNIVKNRLKILYKSKIIVVLSIIMISLFMFLAGALFESAEESSKIPIGVVNEDKTDLSKNIISSLYDDNIINLIEIDKDRAFSKLKKGQLEAVYILKKGLKENIINEDYEEIIDVYYIQGSTIARFIGDIFAEKVLRDVCLIKSLSLLERAINNNEIDNKDDLILDARRYANTIANYSNHQYYIKVDYVTSNNDSINVENLENSIIYKKMILGIMISFISFYLLFASISIVKDKETFVFRRINISTTKCSIIIIGDFISLVISGSVISLAFSVLNSIYGNNHLYIFTNTFIILVFFVICISSIIIFFTNMIDKVSAYVMLFTILILIMGIVSGSFFSIDLLGESSRILAMLTPNYWTLNALTDIITIQVNYIDHIEYIGISIMYTTIMLLLTYISRKYIQKVVK